MARLRPAAAGLLLLLLVPCVWALFEDQVGIDNWAQKHLGRVTSAVLNSRQVLVATDQAVLASLSPRSSDLRARPLFIELKLVTEYFFAIFYLQPLPIFIFQFT